MKLTLLGGEIEFQLQEETRPALLFAITIAGVTTKNVSMLILPVDKKVLCSVSPVDAKGNPAPIKGDPTWSTSNEDICTVIPERESKLKAVWSAWVVPTGDQIGECQVNVVADADLGPEVDEIIGVLDLEVVGGKAVGFQIAHSAPEPIEKNEVQPVR